MALLQFKRAALSPLILLASLIACEKGHAHGGGLNADGCHNDRKNGGYHCHRAPSRPSNYGNTAPPSSTPARPSGRTVPPGETTLAPATSRVAPERGTAQGVDPLLRLVMRVQAALLSKGYDPGAIDGNLGARTHAALRAFQSDHGLTGNGALTSETIAALGVRQN